jgi:uncharacterized protein YdaU (DUF1376 family)
MAQNLPAPCFQVYAANTLANISFRQSDLAARGLVYTLLCELWVNHRLPCNPAVLAKVLGLDAGELAAALPAAMAFFNIDGEDIYSSQLEDYQQRLDERRVKQQAGGKKGADTTNKKNKRAERPADIGLQSNPATPQVYPRVSSTAKNNTVKQSQTQSTERAVVNDPFVEEYEAAEARDYEKPMPC